MTNKYLFVIAALIIGAAVGFFGGMKYQQTKIPSFGNGNFRQMLRDGQRPGGSGATGARFSSGGRVMGEVISADETSLTVKQPDGSTKIVLYSENTVFSRSETGSKADITAGMQVGIFGPANADGSITAADIQINPVMRVIPTGSPEQ